MISRKISLALASLAFLCILAGALAPVASAGQQDIRIYSLDQYTKEADMGDEVNFIWIVDNSGVNKHLVDMDVTGNAYDWHAVLEPPYFILESGGFQSINLTVTVPDTRDYPTFTFNMFLNLTDMITGESWSIPIEGVTVNIAGGAYVPPTRVLGLFENFLPAPLDNEWGVFLLSVLVWLFIGLIVIFALVPIVKFITRKTKTTLDDRIIAILKWPVFILIFTYGVVSSVEVLDFPWSVVNGLETLWKLILIIVVGWLVFKIFQDVFLYWAKKYAEKTATKLDDVLLPLFEKVAMVIIIAGAIVASLNLMGVDVTMLVAGMGIAGLVIAFAAQDTLGNFISGMSILSDRPFKVGDTILMQNGDYCKVDRIGMRSTKLYNTFTHSVVILPNNRIANEMVTNLAEPDVRKKINIIVNVAYGADMDKAKKIILDTVNAHPDILKDTDKKPLLRLSELGEYAIKFTIFAWVNNMDNQWRTASEIREQILRKFKAEGMEVPYPHRVVYLNKEDKQ
jgi:MscS family membrane protein